MGTPSLPPFLPPERKSTILGLNSFNAVLMQTAVNTKRSPSQTSGFKLCSTEHRLLPSPLSGSNSRSAELPLLKSVLTRPLSAETCASTVQHVTIPAPAQPLPSPPAPLPLALMDQPALSRIVVAPMTLLKLPYESDPHSF